MYKRQLLGLADGPPDAAYRDASAEDRGDSAVDETAGPKSVVHIASSFLVFMAYYCEAEM